MNTLLVSLYDNKNIDEHFSDELVWLQIFMNTLVASLYDNNNIYEHVSGEHIIIEHLIGGIYIFQQL